MNQEIKKKLVAALRSGKYQQGRGYLKVDENCNCIGGVICELAAEAGIVEARQINENDGPIWHWGYVSKKDENTVAYGVLPDEVAEWAGLTYLNQPSLFYQGQVSPIYWLNDTEGVTFEKFAELIEDQW
jgi:hypothetical protein